MIGELETVTDSTAGHPSEMVVELIGPDDVRWRNLLAEHAHDFYHRPEYVRLEADRLGGEVVAAYLEHHQVRLLLPLIGRAIPGTSDRDLISPYGYPGPVAVYDDAEVLNTALRAVVATLRDNGYVTMFVRLHPLLELPDAAFTGLGAVVAHGHTVSIDLTRDDAEQWRHMRGRYRTFLKRSERLGHRSSIDDAGTHLDRFIDLYLDTMRRQDAAPEYFFSRDYLAGLWHQLPGCMRLGVVEIDDVVVCAGLFAESNGIIQYHLSGTDAQALELSPLKVLIDFVRRWASARGATVLHLGGGLGGADDSLLQFKAGFSDGREMFKSWRVVLDEHRYRELCGGHSGTSTGFFPAYRDGTRGAQR